MTRYVWLDLLTGEFSNSWSEEEHQKYITDNGANGAEHHSYFNNLKCLNDDKFEFYNLMQVTTKRKKKKKK